MAESFISGAAYLVAAVALAGIVRYATRTRGRVLATISMLLASGLVWIAIVLTWSTPPIFLLILVSAVIVVVGVRAGRGVLSLRCATCGNYYPSRESFVENQVCLRCHNAAQGQGV